MENIDPALTPQPNVAKPTPKKPKLKARQGKVREASYRRNAKGSLRQKSRQRRSGRR
jgi:hypothetical protein